MVEILRKHGETPTKIPDVNVYIPVYDSLILKEAIYCHPYHATDTYSIRTSSLTPRGFFELGGYRPVWEILPGLS